MLLLSSADFLQNYFFSKNSFRKTIRVLDPDQVGHSVGPDLGTNCLQSLPADNKSCHEQGKS